MLGMLLGLVIGGKAFGVGWLFGGFIGAGIGWVAGFIFALLCVLAAGKSDSGKARCPVCRNMFPPEMTTCGWCGSSLEIGAADPLVTDSLHAYRYGLSNIETVMRVVILLVMADVAVAACVHFSEAFEQVAKFRTLLYPLCGLVVLLVAMRLVRLMMSAVRRTMLSEKRAPDMPRLFSLKNIVEGFLGVVLLAGYFVTLFLIPLLPMALVLLAAPGRKNAFNPARTAKLAWRHARDYAILWMVLMLYVAGMALSITIILEAYSQVPCAARVGDGMEALMCTLLSAALTAFLGGFCCIFGLSICRCVGLFGKYNARALIGRNLGDDPAKPQRADTEM
jgi:hypothetical protein